MNIDKIVLRKSQEAVNETVVTVQKEDLAEIFRQIDDMFDKANLEMLVYFDFWVTFVRRKGLEITLYNKHNKVNFENYINAKYIAEKYIERCKYGYHVKVDKEFVFDDEPSRVTLKIFI